MITNPIQQANTARTVEYLEWQRRRNRSPETLFIYGDVLAKLMVWLGETPLAVAPVKVLEGFIGRPRSRRRPGQPVEGSPATRRRDTAIVRGFYKYLTERGHLAMNPAQLLISPAVHNIAPKAIDDATWRAVWCHPSIENCDRLMLVMGAVCGLRRREMVDLTPANFDLAGERLVDFKRKGGDEASFPYGSAVRLISERLPNLLPEGPDAVLSGLSRYVQARALMPHILEWGDRLGRADDPRLRGRVRLDNYPVGWTPPNVLNNRLRTILRRCGLPETTASPHALRHTAITNWLRAQVPIHVVSRLAAHADMTTTMRYVKTADDPLAEMIGQVPPSRTSRWT